MTASSPAALRAITIREVGLRDGLQSIATLVSTEHKKDWLREAHAAGQREVEVGSFVPPKLMPQLADTAEVLAYARTLPGLFASVLVPNLKGAERAIAECANLMILPLSASHEHSLANLRKTPDEVVAEMGRIRAARDAAGSRTLIEGGVGTAFGCTIQGEVAESEVLRLMQALLDAGADRVSLADTVGYANPNAVSRLFEKALKVAGDRFCCGHFHDTPGWRWPTSTPRCNWACRASTPRWLASAAARMRRAPAATRPPRTWPSCWRPWATPLASTCRPCWHCARRSAAGSPASPRTVRCGARACRGTSPP